MPRTFGSRETFAIEVDPLSDPPFEPDPAAAASWARLRLWVAGKNLAAHSRANVMTIHDAIDWPAAFLARWLVRAWPGLWFRAGAPLPTSTEDPLELCRLMDHHLAENDPTVDDDWVELRDEFAMSHCLAAAAAGGVMPPVHLSRESGIVQLSWDHRSPNRNGIVFHESQGRARIPADTFADAVTGFLKWVDVVAGEQDVELRAMIRSWLDSMESAVGAESALLGYVHPWAATGDAPSIAELETLLVLPESWKRAGGRLDPSTLSASVVFRALSPILSKDEVRAVLELLRSFPGGGDRVEPLKRLRCTLHGWSTGFPHDQGYFLAGQVRQQLGNEDRVVDIERLLRDHGVEIRDDDFRDASIDAATVWNDDHGPVVVLNRIPRHRGDSPRRMTLAHEFCHLLVDGVRASDMTSVSCPWTPPGMERRANAFAAELLLPMTGMKRVLGRLPPNRILDEDAKGALMSEFRVGATVCEHQVRNRLGARFGPDV